MQDELFKSYCDPALCTLAKFGIGQTHPMHRRSWTDDMLSEPRLYFMDVNVFVSN